MEFFGAGVSQLSIADRATIANMAPDYGATVGYFPIDKLSISYLRQTGNLFGGYHTAVFISALISSPSIDKGLRVLDDRGLDVGADRKTTVL